MRSTWRYAVCVVCVLVFCSAVRSEPVEVRIVSADLLRSRTAADMSHLKTLHAMQTKADARSKAFADTRKPRDWTGKDGEALMTASLLGVEKGIASLEKMEGKKREVATLALKDMSDKDRRWTIEQMAARKKAEQAKSRERAKAKSQFIRIK